MTHGHHRAPLFRWLEGEQAVAARFPTHAHRRGEGWNLMRAFADLYVALDETTKTNEKVAHLKHYFPAPPADAAWAVNFLIGRRPKRLLESRKLVQWAIEETGVPEWMLAECQHAVGDFAEVIALLLPPADASGQLPLHFWVEQRLLPLRDADDETRRGWLISAWREMNERQRFAWNKLITGEFRVGVSQSLVVRALAEVSGVSGDLISHRLMGEWQPTPAFWRQLVSSERDRGRSRRAAHPLKRRRQTGESRRLEPAVSVLPRLSDRGRDRAIGSNFASGRSNGNGMGSAPN